MRANLVPLGLHVISTRGRTRRRLDWPHPLLQRWCEVGRELWFVVVAALRGSIPAGKASVWVRGLRRHKLRQLLVERSGGESVRVANGLVIAFVLLESL